MDWGYFSEGRPNQFLIGLAGAAAMAATDFRSWRRVFQHLIVGGLTAVWGTPIFAPAIAKLLGIFTVDLKDQYNAAVFITGAFGIYVFEFIRAFFAARKAKLIPLDKTKATDDDRDGDNDSDGDGD